MLPLIEKEIIEKRNWSTKEEILDIYALSQSVPGVIAVNTATFFGNRRGGFWGAIAATTGVILPSLLVIMTIASLFVQIQGSDIILRIFNGIRAAVAGLVASAALRVVLQTAISRTAIILGLIAFALNVFTDIHAVWLIVGGAACGFILNYVLKTSGK